MTDTPTDRAALEALAHDVLSDASLFGVQRGAIIEAASTLRALAARAEKAEALLREAGEIGVLIDRADERLDQIHDQDAGTWRLDGLFDVEELVCAAASRARALAAKIRGRGDAG